MRRSRLIAGFSVIAVLAAVAGIVIGLALTRAPESVIPPSPGPSSLLRSPTVPTVPTTLAGSPAAAPAVPTTVVQSPASSDSAGAYDDPKVVTIAFIYAWAEFRWDDQPSPLKGQLARARPWVTSDYFDFLSKIREPPFLTQKLIEAQTVQKVTELDNCTLVQPRSETLKTYMCLFILQTSSAIAAPSGEGPFWEITVVRRDGRWLVDGYIT